jgi:hypothetical protein
MIRQCRNQRATTQSQDLLPAEFWRAAAAVIRLRRNTWEQFTAFLALPQQPDDPGRGHAGGIRASPPWSLATPLAAMMLAARGVRW